MEFKFSYTTVQIILTIPIKLDIHLGRIVIKGSYCYKIFPDKAKQFSLFFILSTKYLFKYFRKLSILLNYIQYLFNEKSLQMASS